VPCRAVPCRAVPCRAVPCRAVPCRAVPCRAVPCRAVPCRAVPQGVPAIALSLADHKATQMKHYAAPAEVAVTLIQVCTGA
jgi:hypothetical protein